MLDCESLNGTAIRLLCFLSVYTSKFAELYCSPPKDTKSLNVSWITLLTRSHVEEFDWNPMYTARACTIPMNCTPSRIIYAKYKIFGKCEITQLRTTCTIVLPRSWINQKSETLDHAWQLHRHTNALLSAQNKAVVTQNNENNKKLVSFLLFSI